MWGYQQLTLSGCHMQSEPIWPAAAATAFTLTACQQLLFFFSLSIIAVVLLILVSVIEYIALRWEHSSIFCNFLSAKARSLGNVSKRRIFWNAKNVNHSIWKFESFYIFTSICYNNAENPKSNLLKLSWKFYEYKFLQGVSKLSCHLKFIWLTIVIT